MSMIMSFGRFMPRVYTPLRPCVNWVPRVATNPFVSLPPGYNAAVFPQLRVGDTHVPVYSLARKDGLREGKGLAGEKTVVVYVYQRQVSKGERREQGRRMGREFWHGGTLPSLPGCCEGPGV
jgi:hypothetical protein